MTRLTDSKKLFLELVLKINLSESADEINQVAFQIIESLFGLTPTQILSNTSIPVTDHQRTLLESIIVRVNNHEPVQYITEQAYFHGRKFFVNPSVLIPRPETEELVNQVIRYVHTHPHHKKPYLDFGNTGKELTATYRILDIGTGSGCIPVSLNLELPESEVYATDISEQALAVALKNATTLKANVQFIKHDILKEKIPLTELDIITSNPPYVTEKEKSTLNPNVIEYEPHLALFVSDNDPLIFYKALAVQCMDALKPGGKIFVEINERYGKQTKEVFDNQGYQSVDIMNDMMGKERMVIATK